MNEKGHGCFASSSVTFKTMNKNKNSTEIVQLKNMVNKLMKWKQDNKSRINSMVEKISMFQKYIFYMCSLMRKKKKEEN